MIDTGTFADYLEVKEGSTHYWLLQPTLDAAYSLVDELVGTSNVPVSVKDRAVLVCGAELWNQRKSPNGVSQFTEFDSATPRPPRDPLTGVYPLVRMYVGPGIA